MSYAVEDLSYNRSKTLQKSSLKQRLSESRSDMAVHVVGAGALGSMIAARLSAAGVETRLVLRTKSSRWRAVDASSNRVRVLVDGAPQDVATAPDARDAKLVLLCTKVWQARDALRQAKTSAGSWRSATARCRSWTTRPLCRR